MRARCDTILNDKDTTAMFFVTRREKRVAARTKVSWAVAAAVRRLGCYDRECELKSVKEWRKDWTSLSSGHKRAPSRIPAHGISSPRRRISPSPRRKLPSNLHGAFDEVNVLENLETQIAIEVRVIGEEFGYDHERLSTLLPADECS